MRITRLRCCKAWCTDRIAMARKVLSLHSLPSAREQSAPSLCLGKRLMRSEIGPLKLRNGLKSPAKGEVFRQKLAS